jgi:molecular chaperone DnaK
LSEDEVQRMVKDAESHREEDKKFHELVGVRNQADGLIHSVTKAMGDKPDSEIVSAISQLKEAMKSDDKESIESKTKILSYLSSKLQQQQQQAQPEAAAETETTSTAKSDENVVDAEFTEVKEDKDEHK